MAGRNKHDRSFRIAARATKAGRELDSSLAGEDQGDDDTGRELETLLADEEESGKDGSAPFSQGPGQSRPLASNASFSAYNTIHRVEHDNVYLDDPYTIEQLNAPSMIASRIKPLVEKLYNGQDITLVYCLLVNRVQFLREQSNHAHHESVNITRAALCESVASKVLQQVDEDHPGSKGLLLLANILVEGFDPFQGVRNIIIQNRSPRKFNAFELAVLSESKLFLSSSACQKVVNAVQKGRIVYTPSSPLDLLPDRYDIRPISLYDPRTAPLLNHYRLIVPRIRNVLEICQFVLLLVFYILVMRNRNVTRFSVYEIIFCVYTSGWVLDQFASILEHGWRLYTRNLWSFLDVAFAVIYGTYLTLRICGFVIGNVEVSRQALDILSMGAPILVPRLAFNLMSENMLFVSIRAMMADFSMLSLLAVWCSAGFLLAMTWLSHGLFNPTTISKWMLWVWFAMDGTGIERSVELHWLLGPTLMIAFAFLGNTLFLTILVAMLSHTFSKIVSDATVENQYRRAVMTFAAVKSDAIFAYQPPFNLLALCLMLPLRLVVSPRRFHRANVMASRVLNAPLLLIICIDERSSLWRDAEPTLLRLSKPRSNFMFRAVSKLYGYDDVRAVFDNEPSSEELSDTYNWNGYTEGSKSPQSRDLARAYRSRRTHQMRSDRNPEGSSAGFVEGPHKEPHTLRGLDSLENRTQTSEASIKRIEDMLCGMRETLDNIASEGRQVQDIK